MTVDHADELVTLIAPPLCDEVNHGTVRIHVDNDGRVRVPRRVAKILLHNTGFLPAPEDKARS